VFTIFSGNPDLIGLSASELKSKRLCSEHFDASYITSSGKLLVGAMPFPSSNILMDVEDLSLPGPVESSHTTQLSYPTASSKFISLYLDCMLFI